MWVRLTSSCWTDREQQIVSSARPSPNLLKKNIPSFMFASLFFVLFSSFSWKRQPRIWASNRSTATLYHIPFTSSHNPSHILARGHGQQGNNHQILPEAGRHVPPFSLNNGCGARNQPPLFKKHAQPMVQAKLACQLKEQKPPIPPV